MYPQIQPFNTGRLPVSEGKHFGVAPDGFRSKFWGRKGALPGATATESRKASQKARVLDFTHLAVSERHSYKSGLHLKASSAAGPPARGENPGGIGSAAVKKAPELPQRAYIRLYGITAQTFPF